MMSQDQGFVQCVDSASTGSPQAKSGAYDSSDFIELYNLVAGNDLLANDLFNQTYDFSPELNSSMTTPSLIYDVPTPQDLNDSPLFNAPFMSSPSLDPAIGFFPDLSNDHNASNTSTRSLMQLSSAPSVPSLPSVNIPWTTDLSASSSTDNNVHSSSTSPSVLSNFSDVHPSSTSPSVLSSFSNVNSPVLSSNTTSSASTSPLTTSLRTRNRKRSANEIDKDPIIVADELAMKRAKNTDAARRSRLRKVKRMESLEKEVTILKNENIDLQTRIAVLESEKKGLEDKNAEKDLRVKLMEQRLTEAHDRLVKINNTNNK